MPVTVEFGKCDACGDNNIKSAIQCRSCAQRLPWAKPLDTRSTATISSQPARNIDWGQYAGMGVGGLIVVVGAFLWCGNVFGFCRTFPFAGYATMFIGSIIFKAACGGD